MSSGPADQGAVDAIVLAGGGGTRLGGTDKAAVTVGGRPMLAHVLDAVAAARRVVVVGPPTLDTRGAERVQEDPPFGGPAAGLAAGLDHLGPGGDVPVLVLACDLPLAGRIVPVLLEALDPVTDHSGCDAVAAVDADGRCQYLLAVYRRPALAAAVATLRASGGLHGASMRRLVEQLDVRPVPDLTGAARDGDTWEDVAELDTILTRRDS
ncbi:molybdenum cofactor guanylyltransferase [Actinotalea sp.]|uniref:molybdenum cofactor guanylyltransferase n=1 Tax=Actinotalea sp. TaxID=1872145 RepID=UPI00356719A2